MTRSPIELFWTAKKKLGEVQTASLNVREKNHLENVIAKQVHGIPMYQCFVHSEHRGSAWRCCVASNMYLVLGDLRRPTPQKYLFPIRMKYSILFVMKYYLLVCNKKWFDNLFLNERAKSACKCLFGHNLAKNGREIARAG